MNLELRCLLASLIFAATAGARELPPPHVALRAGFGDIVTTEGTLDVELSADSLDGTMDPVIHVSIKRQRPCPPPDRAACAGVDDTGICSDDWEKYPVSCGFESYSRGYGDVDELIARLQSAITRSRTGTAYQASFGCETDPCRKTSRCEGSVSYAPDPGVIAFSLQSSGPFALDAESAADFVGTLIQARDVLAHLRPKIDAFNRTPADPGVPVDLDWIHWKPTEPADDKPVELE